jgi:hypothetical protein
MVETVKATPPAAKMAPELGNTQSIRETAGDVTPQGVETGNLQAPTPMGPASQTAPSGLTTGIRTGQTVPPGPSQ